MSSDNNPVSDTSDTPIEPDGDAGYTSTPTHVRLSGDQPEWSIDGVDNDLNYTEAVWTFEKFDDAVAAIPAFVKETTEDGIEWQWDKQRPHTARHISQHSVNTHCRRTA
jgi:hypothetical protein